MSLTTVAAIAVIADPGARLVPRILGSLPFRWLGQRSYGIYLWHWPIFAITRPQLDVPLAGLPLLALRLTLTLGVAEVSYHFVESPVRSGALGRAWQNWREAHGRQRRRLGWRWAGGIASFLFFTVLLGDSVVRAQPPAPPPYLAVAAIDTIDSPAAASTGALGGGPVANSSGSALPTPNLAPTPSFPEEPAKPVAPANSGSSATEVSGLDASSLGLVGRAIGCLTWTPLCDSEVADHGPQLPGSTPHGPATVKSVAGGALGASAPAGQAQRPISGGSPARSQGMPFRLRPAAPRRAGKALPQHALLPASQPGRAHHRVIAIGDSVMFGGGPVVIS